MPQKILFIDRDGTLIYEPPGDFRVTLQEYRLLPGVTEWLGRIARELGYTLVMVTNQDGLGREEYPQEIFDAVQAQLMQALAAAGIHFEAVHVDDSYEHEQKDTRKPGTGMLRHYLSGEYDLKNSFVVGDRITDVRLAQNLGVRAVFFLNYDKPDGWEDKIAAVVNSWEEVYRYLAASA